MEFDVFQEPIYYQNPQLCIKVMEFRVSAPEVKMRDRAQWHYHKEIEFVLVRQGTHEIHTVNRVYRLEPGDVVVVGSSQLHRGHKVGDDELAFVVLHFDLQPYFDPAMLMYYRHFSEIYEPLEALNYIFVENVEVKRQVERIILAIHDEITLRPKGYEIAASMHIKHLLLTLLRADRKGLLQAHEWSDGELMKRVMDYVDEHLADKIEMEQVSRLAGMSYSYFSKYFKRAMGASFTDYINRRRIHTAERLLVTSDRSVTDIAAAVGIANMAHFYEMFKRFNGCTPKEYLRRLGSAGIVESAGR
ncbi:helix-turn-helix transcriptional regulator [Paenibacillus koleovorans]|uniref:helix-turn-helix transcriptional regulator n=1 Tax=Paenibacillus koleovorans TaxID=121608 RepID=UPI000FDA5191|nr:AraC family transcriptional regulator [Paenibacillus koleovorans]